MLGWFSLERTKASPTEALAGMFVSQGSGDENLDRYFAIEVFIQGAVDLAHAPDADRFKDPVVPELGAFERRLAGCGTTAPISWASLHG